MYAALSVETEHEEPTVRRLAETEADEPVIVIRAGRFTMHLSPAEAERLGNLLLNRAAESD